MSPAPSPPDLHLALIGAGIQASRTPALHMQEAAAQGIRCLYGLIDLDRVAGGADALADLLAKAEAQGFAGLNITYPCKQSVIPLLHALSDEARVLGAVNTVVLRGGRRIGHNTDCSGFGAAFDAGLGDAPRDQVVQLGAGGAGSAVAEALLARGVGRLWLHDSDPARAAALAAALAARHGAGRAVTAPELAAAVAGADGLVNCTPVGMAKLPGLPLPAAMLHARLWVAEIVYFPLETALLAAARALGCRTLDGGHMAVFQAAHAFRLFTGREPDVARMQARFRAGLAATPAAADQGAR
jgi:shikimate dehydrogenase